ncbi:MAG: response regulator [Alphaproteobacteria bacterium]|nr:response regulator [Alphaproteobacteria bacterium]
MAHADLDVLIVDDDDLVAEAIADGVRLAGYTVCGVAATGDQAVELMRRHRPRLALVDVDLGDGQDGVNAARQLAGIGPITVIFVTGYPDKIRPSDSDVGVAWMEKPYRVLDLINALDIVSARSEQRAVTIPIPAALHMLRRDQALGTD